MLIGTCECCGNQVEVKNLDASKVCADCRRWLEDESPMAFIGASVGCHAPIPTEPMRANLHRPA